MHYCLFDDATRLSLLPFTHTRPVADVRCGILTQRERWERLLSAATSSLTAPYLQPAFPGPAPEATDILYINGSLFADAGLIAAISQLELGQKIVQGNTIVAARTAPIADISALAPLTSKEYSLPIKRIAQPWDIFAQADHAIRADFELLTLERHSLPLPAGVLASGQEHIFIEPGAKIGLGCIINAETGPVYIGRDAVLLEGTMIHGSLAVCEGAVIKMGAKIYGATTIGPGCKVGGELNNVVFFANSNKGHDGYLGNAVIGEWCNLGADTNCSNLKNNYDVIKIYSEHHKAMINTGLIFCGLIMADHSKCGINTMFNTGTVVGVSANIFGCGFPDKHIPSFSWGGINGVDVYQFEKALETANRMMGRRNRSLSDADVAMLRHVYDEALAVYHAR